VGPAVVDDCCASLASTFGPQLQRAGERLQMHHFNVGHLPGHRHQVVHHRSVEQMAVLVAPTLLEQGTANALHNRAANLLVHQLGIDHAPAVPGTGLRPA